MVVRLVSGSMSYEVAWLPKWVRGPWNVVPLPAPEISAADFVRILKARGIEAEAAKKLVVRGFLSEVIQKIEIPRVEERLVAVIEAELERSGS